jgi:hypothetical protein
VDAFKSQSGVVDVKTDLRRAEAYLLVDGSFTLTAQQARTLMERDYGYGFRGMEKTSTPWDELGRR